MTTQIPNSMLVSPGGGLVQVGALAASTTLSPNATAVQNAIAAAGGAIPALRIAATTVIPLDTAGNGKAMPLVAGDTISITADITPTVGAGAVLDGVCVIDYLSSGLGDLILTNYNARGDVFAAEAGRLFTVTCMNRTSGKYAIVQKGGLAPVFAPNAATLVIGAIAQTTQGFTITPGAVDSTHNPALNYQVYFSADGGTTYAAFGSPNSTLSRTVTGLTAGTVYNYKVNASNTAGSVFSAVVTQSTAAAGRTDTFARADEYPINIPSDGGSAWLNVGTHGPLAIVSNVATGTAVYSIRASALLFTSPNMTVSTTFRFSASDGVAFMMARLVNTDSYGLRMNVSFNGSVTFYSNVASAPTALAAGVTVAAFVLETVHTMSVSVVGDVYTCKIDGATIATFTSATYNTQLYGGIGHLDSSIAAPVKFTAFSIA